MEGFGIPPLEAMACGVPVIVSDIEVFRETYGGVPIYVELNNPESWKQAFDSLEDSQLIMARRLLGLELVRSFSLERMSISLMHAIEAIWPDLPQKTLCTIS
jgi:glycosyltransferase involved in cell wall biosynthesis